MSTLKTGALRGTSGTADSVQLHASNQSVTFPGDVTVSGSMTGGGKVLQVVSNTVTAVLNNDTASGGNWIPGHLETSITPSATSSKILITGCIQVDAAIAMGVSAQLQRDSALIAGANGPAAGNRQRVHSGVLTSGATTMVSMMINYLDSPSSTSSETYRLKFFHTSGNTRQLYINRSSEDTDGTNFSRPVSTITLTEISG